MEYVLTEGQKQNNAVGYIEIPEEKVMKSLRLLGVEEKTED